MSTPDGRSIFNLISNGYTRTVCEVGTGTRGVTIPKELAEEKNIELGDEVVVRDSDDKDDVVELHFDDSKTDE